MDECIEAVSVAGFSPLRDGPESGLLKLEKSLDSCTLVFDKAALNFRLYLNSAASDRIFLFQKSIKQLRTNVSQIRAFSSGGEPADDSLQELTEQANDMSSNWKSAKNEILSLLSAHISEKAGSFK